MGFISEVVLLRCVIGVFFFYSVLCLYVAFRHPDLPKRIMQRFFGEDFKVTQTYTNWWVLWFCLFFFLALWIAFELRLKDLIS